MSQHKKQATFLKTLLTYDDSAEHRQLQERIAVAERDEKCIGCACRLVGLAALLAFAGLGYCAVLLPEFFHNSRHFLIQFFCVLGLGSLLCLLVFIGLWLWYRGMVNRLHDECRKVITSLVQSRLKAQPRPAPTVLVQESEVATYETRTQSATPHSETEVIALRKAS
jgi:hypothetical protein